MLAADSLQAADSLPPVDPVDSLLSPVDAADSLLPPVAQEQVVECGPNKLGDIFTFVSQGSFSDAVPPLRKKNLKRYARKFIIEGGKLFYVGVKREEKREVVIDPERKRQIFLECHFNDVGGHLGQKKTVHRIQSRYYWLGIIRDVVDWIKVCETCRGAERSKSQSRAVRAPRMATPWDCVSALILGPFPLSPGGNSHVLVVLDHFSKWPEAFPLQTPDPECVARGLSSCVYRFGAPKIIALTQSPDFCSQVTRELREKWSLPLTISSVDQPLDCSAPALRHTVLQLVEDRQEQWEGHLEQTLFELRTNMDQNTKYSPFSLLFSRMPSRSAQSSDQSQEKSCPHLRAIQEHQEALRHKVVENMNVSHKQEKRKNSKQKSHKIRITSNSFFNGSNSADDLVKKHRSGLYFPEDSAPSRPHKPDLDFHLQTVQ
ncbi:gypsy retrotransposon integrase-like protein 1 [Periophthalmus magnuspinnatus]|uniref:gypsy retrotransposon integrase-like protein 1 n=1 Tax=Periophthalmus magnuspinnatus TaxID=409849 RepID=UPI002436379D|nr:gypsy retrotransposon integrase-like protein 1 [Periophthalmus magnuspinnatus]